MRNSSGTMRCKRAHRTASRRELHRRSRWSRDRANLWPEAQLRGPEAGQRRCWAGRAEVSSAAQSPYPPGHLLVRGCLQTLVVSDGTLRSMGCTLAASPDYARSGDRPSSCARNVSPATTPSRHPLIGRQPRRRARRPDGIRSFLGSKTPRRYWGVASLGESLAGLAGPRQALQTASPRAEGANRSMMARSRA